jgi:hypothetical protein
MLATQEARAFSRPRSGAVVRRERRRDRAQPMAVVSVEEFVALLDRAKLNGAGWIARCPAHDDCNPSLSLNEGDDGRIVLNLLSRGGRRGARAEALRSLRRGARGSIPSDSRQVRQVDQIGPRLVVVDGERVDRRASTASACVDPDGGVPLDQRRRTTRRKRRTCGSDTRRRAVRARQTEPGPSPI